MSVSLPAVSDRRVGTASKEEEGRSVLFDGPEIWLQAACCLIGNSKRSLPRPMCVLAATSEQNRPGSRHVDWLC